VTYTRIVPLGGLGEIGMNCLALESPDGVLVIDCGVTFPHGNHGVDVIHPLFDYLEDREADLLGIVITHGHEDHIGALPYLLRRMPIPVWGPRYALSLIRERLREFSEVPDIDLTPTTPRKRFSIGHYEVEPLRVTHSIPDSTALAIDTPGGTIIHTGDFKLEDDPLDDEPSDAERFQALGDRGVSLLLSDSTNVDVPGTAGGERQVAAALHQLIARQKQRVIVGMFPSNVYRLKTLVAVAQATGRKLCLLGRSAQNHVRAASELGRLSVRSEILVSPDRAREVPRSQLLVVASGTQAEPQSALAKLAAGDHPRLTLEAGDAVLFSSRTIPGNERAVWSLLCDLERRGAVVHFASTDPDLHVSGHACREEQLEMLSWVRPRAFIPVHGTYHHLMRHASLAKSTGVREVSLLENGQTAILDAHGLSEGARVRVGRVNVSDGVEIHDDVIRERVVMGEVGAVFVTVPIARSGALAGTVTVAARGIVSELPQATLDDDARVAIEQSLRDMAPTGGSSAHEAIRDCVRRAARKVYARAQPKPMVVVTLREG
jgi:ribonuclease J